MPRKPFLEIVLGTAVSRKKVAALKIFFIVVCIMSGYIVRTTCFEKLKWVIVYNERSNDQTEKTWGDLPIILVEVGHAPNLPVHINPVQSRFGP